MQKMRAQKWQRRACRQSHIATIRGSGTSWGTNIGNVQGAPEYRQVDWCFDGANFLPKIVIKSPKIGFQDRFHIYLILELLRGPELLTKIRHAKHFTEQEASRIFRKIVSAVSFVHKKGAVHRDLKPEASIE